MCNASWWNQIKHTVDVLEMVSKRRWHFIELLIKYRIVFQLDAFKSFLSKGFSGILLQ
jgi:hypothetical protein